MGEYAEIINNRVVRVLVVDGSEEEAIAWLQANISTNLWVKSDEIRIRRPGPGDEYHPGRDVFTPPKPFESWEFNEQRGIYTPPLPAPIAVPIGYVYKWSEEFGRWLLQKLP